MAWLAVNKDKSEVICGDWKKPRKDFEAGKWSCCIIYGDFVWDNRIYLPKGTIKKLIGRDLTWKDDPVELK